MKISGVAFKSSLYGGILFTTLISVSFYLMWQKINLMDPSFFIVAPKK